MAGSWIASHLWTQYEFTQDKQYLAETAYPLLKGNAQFILDFLAKDPKSGYLMTGPSISPENWFRTAGGEEMVAFTANSCTFASSFRRLPVTVNWPTRSCRIVSGLQKY